jgi:hypothetical protein
LRHKGFTAKKTEVLGVIVPDLPGSSVRAIQLLSEAGINVEYTYAFVIPQAGSAFVLLRVNDNEKAATLLQAAGVHLAAHTEIF